MKRGKNKLLIKVKDVLGRDLLKVFSLNAIATLVKMLTGFVSVKVVAGLVGPGGIALLGQLNNFATIFLTLSTGGINSGVTKYVAENARSQRKINTYLRTSIWITISLSLICALILIFGSDYFSHFILKDTKYRSIIIVFGLTIILYSLNGLLLSIINGYKEFKSFVKINIVSSLVGLLFTILLSYSYGIYGALLAAITYQSVVFIITLYLSSKYFWFKRSNFFGKFNLSAGKQLGRYSVMALISAATVPMCQLVVRGYLTSHTSIDDAGIWEGMNRISGMYLMVITTSLSVYYLPRLAEIRSDSEIRAEILSVYKFILPQLIVITFIIYFLKSLIIKILFNSDFVGMESYFMYQLAGDFFKIGSWLLAYQMLAKSMMKMYIISEIIFGITFVGLAILFIKLYGAVGASMGYALNYLLYWVVMVFLFKKILLIKEK